jgi:hypothetical protein
MLNKVLISLAAAAAAPAPSVLAAPAMAQPQSPPPAERAARIPFVSFGNVRDFRAVGRDIVYLQDAHRNWYRATLLQPCLDLPFAEAIGIDASGTNSVDRFSTLIVGRGRCPIVSLVRSDPPPKKVKQRRRRS